MRVNAPEINTKFGWLNADKNYSIKDFKGKIVLLDFWTFGCINCQHIIPDLKKLEEEYKKELVVIGVHSAKFNSEKDSDRIRKAMMKFGIEHPVVNDADFKVWQEYGVNAWPTVVLIDPDGKVVGQRSGENFYDVVKENIDKLISEFGSKIDQKLFTFKKQEERGAALRFPSKMIVDEDGSVWISDSGNNRILKVSRQGQILLTIGSGKQGTSNGKFSEATFYEPHGLAKKGDILYIADTKNNMIRKADLKNGTVSTIAGNGTLEYYYFNDKWDDVVKPNSPWDLLIDGNDMYIANAGNHQILRMNLSDEKVMRYAGSGREALVNGGLRESAFNQPSGLTKIGNILYVADAEASAIRAIDLKNKTVQTPLGKGLFDFGDKDGSTSEALLQHCVGIKAEDGNIYIADTYNGKVKIFDLDRNTVKTFLSGFEEPNDLLFIGDDLWISDTNNHRLVRYNMKTKEKSAVSLQ